MQEPNKQLCLVTVAFALSFALWGLLSGLAPVLKREWGLSQTQVALMVSIPVLLGSLGRVPMGILADRFGGRKMMSLLLVFSILPAAGVALSPRYEVLLFWAFFLGLIGSTFAVGVSFTSKWFPPERQGTALGIFGAGNIGQSIVVFGGSALAARFGAWQPVVWLFASVAVLWGGIFWLTARDACLGTPRPFRESLALLRSAPLAWRLSLFYFVTFGGFVSMSIYLPSLLTQRFGLELADAGLRAAGFVLLANVTRPLGGWLADRFGGPQVLVGTFVILVGAALLMIPENFVIFSVGALTFAAAAGIGNGAVFKLVAEYFPTETGAVSGLVGALGGLGGFFPPVVLGILLDLTGSYAISFLGLALFALFCGAMALDLHRNPPALAA